MQAILQGRPYASLDELFTVARQAASPLTGAELEAALAGCATPPLVTAESRGEALQEARIREQLAAGVQTYQQRFGRPFLIRTQGRSPAELLTQLWNRLGNDPDTEDRVLAHELRQAALLKLAAKIAA